MPRRRDITSALAARIGTNVRRARESSGQTQRFVAKQAGISDVMICKVERGYSMPGVSTLLDIARALDVEPAALLREVQPVRDVA